MSVRVISQPDPLVTVEEAKLALGFTGTTDRNAQIATLILAAQAELDGPKGSVGICVAEQTIEVRNDEFGDCPIELPGPVISITSVKYLDADGVEQTIDDEGYVLLYDGTVIVAAGTSWPTPYDTSEAVRVVAQVGIEDTDDPRVSLMKSAIIMHVKMSMDMDDVETRRKAINNLVAPLRAMHV